MIYLTKMLYFVIVCRVIFKSALSLRLNVERLFDLWISSARSDQSLITDGKMIYSIIEYLNV